MYSEKLESLIEAIIADGVIEDSEMAVLKKAAIKEGEDPDELEIVVKGRLAKKNNPTTPVNLPNGKLGNVMKCPSCGAQIVGGKAQCPECGYNFTNINANRSAEKLAKGLQELIEKEQRNRKDPNLQQMIFKEAADTKKDPRVIYITNFPVPNTREDLLEFLSSIQPKAKKPNLWRNFVGNFETQIEIEHAYWALYANCVNKARISYSNDSDFDFFFKDYKNR